MRFDETPTLVPHHIDSRNAFKEAVSIGILLFMLCNAVRVKAGYLDEGMLYAIMPPIISALVYFRATADKAPGLMLHWLVKNFPGGGAAFQPAKMNFIRR
jgi:hypothetical protein